MRDKRGGKKPGAGRKPSLTPAKREEIAREYRQRMQAWAATVARARDPIRRKRREIDARMRRRAATHSLPSDLPDDGVIRFRPPLRAAMERDQAELDALPRPAPTTLKRAKGPRALFIAELAKEYRVSPRTIERCLNDF